MIINQLDVFRAVRERLSDPAQWTKYSAARDSDGYTVLPYSGVATCWCLYGAVDLELRLASLRAGPSFVLGVGEIWDTLASKTGPQIGPFNDKSKHADVLDVLDAIIGELEVL